MSVSEEPPAEYDIPLDDIGTQVPQPPVDSNLKIEDVFEILGGFSYYQILATITIISLEIPSAMIALSPILTGASEERFYCATAKNGTTTIPTVASLDDCCGKKCSHCIGMTVSSEWQYTSIVEEFGLICDRAWITQSLESVQMVGSMVGPIVTAFVSDQFGRKKAFYMVCLLMTISSIVSSISGNLWVYGVSRFFAGMAAGSALVAHMNYLMEFLTPSWRVICGSITLWPVGEILLGITGFLQPSWRRLTLATGLPSLLILPVVTFLHESPRWLLCKKRTAEATSVLNSIAKRNGREPLPPQVIEKLQNSIIAETEVAGDDDGQDKKRFLLRHILIFVLVWFSSGLTYLGLSFNMKNVGVSRYLNVILMGFFDFPAEWSGIYFSNKFGRKPTFITGLAMTSLTLLAIAILQLTTNQDGEFDSIIIALCLVGRFYNEASWAVMACLTGEVFPTVKRSLCFSVCSAFGSIGGIIAPWMVMLGKAWAPGPYLIFFALTTTSCIASLRLKEMRGELLEDTANGRRQT